MSNDILMKDLDYFETISDPLNYQTKFFEVLEEGKMEIIKLREDTAKVLISINEIKDKRRTLENKRKLRNNWDEFLKKVQGMVKINSDLAIKSVKSFEALLLEGSKLKEDMGIKYEEDASGFESGKEDIEEKDEDLDDESASKGEASAKRKKPSKDDSEENIEEEDEDLDDESASKGEASAKRKKPSIFDSEEDIEEEGEDLDDEIASKGEASAKRTKPSNDDADDDDSDD